VLATTMGLMTLVISNVTVPPSQTSVIAWRNEPEPLSALVITIGLEVQVCVPAWIDPGAACTATAATTEAQKVAP
jgi:hypothetical protein